MVVLVALNWWRQDVRKVDFSERSNPDCPARPIAMHSGLRLFLKSDVSFYNFTILCKGTSIKESPIIYLALEASPKIFDDFEIPAP